MSDTMMLEREQATWRAKVGLAEMLKGGVIMDVTSVEQAIVAAEAGAQAVMALEKIPADIRAAGGVARMSDPAIIGAIKQAVSIPVMAKCRIGHTVEAQILEALEIDFIDESEVLTPADDRFHVDKHRFRAPFVCGCRDLGEALRRIAEGAALIRTKGEAGTGDVVEAVMHLRDLREEIEWLQTVPKDGTGDDPEERGIPIDEIKMRMGLIGYARMKRVPLELVMEVAERGRLPTPNFSAGGVATPADAALMMHLGAEAVFVGSGVFKSANPRRRAKAIVDAVAHWDDPQLLAEISADLGEAMSGIAVADLSKEQRLARRGR